MEKKRYVSKLQSVFDLADCGDLSLPRGVFGRVMFKYDEKEDLKEFTILTRDIPEDIQAKIKSLLKENIDILYSLDH